MKDGTRDVELVMVKGTDGSEYVTYAPYEWMDEDTDRILVRIMRIKADGNHREQFIPLEKFKEMLKE